MAKQNKNKETTTTKGNSIEQEKYRDQVTQEEDFMTRDKKLGGPNRPSE